MILSDVSLQGLLQSGEMQVDPLDDRLIKRNSILLRLGDCFRTLDSTEIFDTADPAAYEGQRGTEISADSIVLEPSKLVLGVSLERIAIPSWTVGILSGISNVARLGVVLHATSEFVNAGFGQGQPSRVVLELSTIGGRRVRMHAGTPVCHLALLQMDAHTAYDAPSARTGQDGPDPSQLLRQFGHFFAPERQ